MEQLLPAPDVRKNLTVLRNEWEQCRACELGTYREKVNGAFVFGEGTHGSIMFIGEGPGTTEEEEGRPFVGDSGSILREVIKSVFDENFGYYLTNVVSCRSWSYAYDGSGNQQTNRNGSPKIVDNAPSKSQAAACRARLIQEIYIVDPKLIVALGGTAAEALLGHTVSITAISGKLHQIQIPGNHFKPSLTPKGKWARWIGSKEDRKYVWPVEQNMVTYDVMPMLHPAYVARNLSDGRPGYPKHMFAESMERTKRIYSMYLREVYGT